MKKFTIAALLVLSAAFCFAQVPQPTITSPNTDLYVGYIATSPDYGGLFRDSINGFELAFTKTYRPHLAVVGSAAFSFGNPYSVKEFSGTVGPKVNLLTGRVRPYATAQFGVAVQDSNGMYAGDHHPPQKAGKELTEDGLTYRAGVGTDVQLNSKVYWRVLQWDVQPQPWARHTPFYQNFSSGLGWRF